MFTGIIQEKGLISSAYNKASTSKDISPHTPEEKDASLQNSHKHGKELQIKLTVPKEAKIGSSVAVNGVCLTIERIAKDHIFVFASKQTLSVTSLGQLKTDDHVNIEWAMTMSQPLDGHIVYAHADKKIPIENIQEGELSRIFRFSIKSSDLPYIAPKGSIAIDGISLTVYHLSEQADESYFEVMIIPHTFAHTNLSEKKVGDFCNVEFDMLAKYTWQQIKHLRLAKT